MSPRCVGWAGCSAALAAVLACAAQAARAQTDLQRIEIRATAPPRIGGPPAGPVTVLRAEDLVRLGVGTAAQALQYLASQQTTKGVAQSVGEASGGMSEADLRGVGEEKTLVLLDGRRLVAHAYQGGAVDLGAIPMAAIERIEVRRDAGVVLQGSGAVAGVVDFILRRDAQGLALSAELQRPQQRGGAAQRVDLVGGHGVLERDGYAWWVAADLRQQQAIAGRHRRFTRSGIVRDRDGAAVHAVTGGTSFPGDLDGFEPSLAVGCAPPRSLPDPGGDAACRYDELPEIDLVPWQRQATLLADAAWAGPAGTTLRAQWLWAEQQVRSAIAPTPVTAPLPQTSPFWIAGQPARPVDGVDGGIADFRLVEAGRRVDETRSVAQRGVLAAQGQALGWAFDAALLHSTSRVADRLVAGHVDLARIRQGLLDGIIDPFGTADAAGRAALQAAALRGPLASARSALSLVDLRANRAFGADGAAGAQRWQLLAQDARERFAFDVHPNAARAAASELEVAADTRATRHAQALAASWTLAFGSDVDVTLGARFDRIEPGLRRLSPSMGLRWRASPAWSWRASVGNGFRAPTLYEIQAPTQLARSRDRFDDPLLCADGEPADDVPPEAVCGVQPLLRSGGPASAGRAPSSLRAETGRSATLGFAAEPALRTTVAVDLWRLRVRDGIDALSAENLFDDPQRHGARLVRCGSLDAATRASVADCAPWPAFDPIAWALLPNENLVDIDAHGLDFALSWRSGPGALGELALALEAGWVLRHRTRIGRDGVFFDSVGRFAEDHPIHRLQTSAQATWTRGPWSVSLAQRRRSGYLDQSGERRVRATTLVDAALAYTRDTQGLTIGLGVKNLFDRAPPFSDQAETPQTNYDPRLADPTGRAFTLRLAWQWP